MNYRIKEVSIISNGLETINGDDGYNDTIQKLLTEHKAVS